MYARLCWFSIISVIPSLNIQGKVSIAIFLPLFLSDLVALSAFSGTDFTRRASRGHEAARSEKLLRLLSDRAQTLHNDRTFYSKQSYCFCFFILTVFGGEMTSQC